MANGKSKAAGGAKQPKTGKASATAKGGRFKGLGDSASQVVQQAAAVLEEELAAGIVAGKRVEERFRKERRVDEADIADVVERFRQNAHEMVEVVGERIGELQSDATQDLAKRFLTDAHDVLDAVANLANLAPEIVNRLVKTGETKTEPTGGGGGTVRPRG
jgi:hypothetical protein